jgi:predicted oxidoreductase
MGVGGSWGDRPVSDAERQTGVRAVEAALDAGITFFDHADIYCQGKSEQVFAEVLRARPSLRPSILIQSKCGIRLPGLSGADFTVYDFSKKHIVRSVEGSLRRLETDHLDVLLLHRPDPLIQPEEVAAAFDELSERGKVRCFGVSNHTAAQMALLARYLRQPIVLNQLELNIVHSGLFDEGVNMNRERSPNYESGGTLEYCRLHDITIQAYGPLAKGMICGRPLRDHEDPHGRFAMASREVAALAHDKNVPQEAICLAWLLAHPAGIQPIPGSLRPERIAAAALAENVQLSRQEWYRLFIAGRGGPLP